MISDSGPGPGLDVRTARRAGELVVGTYLASLREAKRISRGDAAASAGISWLELRRLEAGAPGLEAATATALLRTYGITAMADVRAVTRLLRPPPYDDVRLDDAPGHQQRLAACEHTARSTRTWAPIWLPTPVQTPDYAACHARWALPQEEYGPATLGMRHLTEKGPRTTLLLDEQLLTRAGPGVEVMARQLGHLRDLMERRLISVRVLPLDSGVITLSSPLTELRLPRARLFVSETYGVLYAGDSAQHRFRLDVIEAAAVSPRQSYDWLGRVQRRFTTRAGASTKA
ncbi:Scr1 family TA system antitoxin-like transcriptional regulator [Streptomyces sp. RerS4]|uniref:Scr1 family TA system antitoxin-like transcriptional regulator n=1 Tax=Streptomyces sp. RerS4 TaxID=2942449 RepID=UPI00201C3284|nr:Scr1 family TA system antitoxin-like transcriptional regulator [Streptomyces sp. RerS4]UQW99113.1 DUF5753 domain-containing protein [Streptomyces sp. RerS4]